MNEDGNETLNKRLNELVAHPNIINHFGKDGYKSDFNIIFHISTYISVLNSYANVAKIFE